MKKNYRNSVDWQNLEGDVVDGSILKEDKTYLTPEMAVAIRNCVLLGSRPSESMVLGICKALKDAIDDGRI